MILNYLKYIVLTKPHTAVSASWEMQSETVQASSALLLHILFFLVSQGSRLGLFNAIIISLLVRVQEFSPRHLTTIKVQTAGHPTSSCAILCLAAFGHYSFGHYNPSVIILAETAIPLYVSVFTLALLFCFMIQFMAARKVRRLQGARSRKTLCNLKADRPV